MRRDIKEIRKIFGRRLLALRNLKKISQEEIAYELGVSRQHYANLENENVNPSFSLLINIVEYFDCSLDYLIGRTNSPDGYPKMHDNIFEYIQNSPDVRFDDFEVTEEDKNKIISAIKYALSILQLDNK